MADTVSFVLPLTDPGTNAFVNFLSVAFIAELLIETISGASTLYVYLIAFAHVG